MDFWSISGSINNGPFDKNCGPFISCNPLAAVCDSYEKFLTLVTTRPNTMLRSIGSLIRTNNNVHNINSYS